MDELIKFTLQEWPQVASILVLFSMTLIFIGLPIGMFYGLKKFVSKDRYLFQENHTNLYRLDTVSGKIHYARGIRDFAELQIVSLKELKRRKQNSD